MGSDYDYVVEGLTKEDAAILRKSLPNTWMGIGEPPGIDVLPGPLRPEEPYVTFFPNG